MDNLSRCKNEDLNNCRILQTPIKYILLLLLLTWTTNSIFGTIDINEAELQYLSDHLLPEECRKLVAAAHIKSYESPNNLNEGETKIPKEIPCFELLIHWNSERGEGRGESHELLQHRLRQIERSDLADWLGETVFHELAVDLNESLAEGLKEITTTEDVFPQPTIPLDTYENDREWQPTDSIFYVLLVMLVITFLIACFMLCWRAFKKRKRNARGLKRAEYEKIENETSGSESEVKFDIRNQNNIVTE